MKLPSHVEHIGSLLRSPELLEANERYIKKEITEEQLVDVQRDATRALVKKELIHNIRPITNGEYDRKLFYHGFHEKLRGIELVPGIPHSNIRPSCPDFAILVELGNTALMEPLTLCTGKIQNEKSPTLEKWLHLRAQVPEPQWKDCKFTFPSPTWWHIHYKEGKAYPTDVYKNDDEYFEDFAVAYRKEFKTLYDAGLRSIQIDDPSFQYFCHEPTLEKMKASGEDADAILDQYIKAHNLCLQDRPADLHTGIHLCRGNVGPFYFTSGGYDRIASKFFNDVAYDTFFLEYDDARSGGFEPLRFLPKTKNVVLGLMTTKTAKLENSAELKERVLQAADIIARGQNTTREDALTRIAISPQCGFSSAGDTPGEGMTEEGQWKKMKLLEEVAREIWG